MAAVAILLLCACSSIPVEQDYDPSVDFTGLGSYAWMERPAEPQTPSLADSGLVRGRVQRSVDARLSAMGLARKSPEEADFLIAYHIGIETQLRVDTARYGYGYGYRGYGRRGYTETHVHQYDVGTLVLDFVSNDEERRLLWRGTGKSQVHETRTPEERERRIRRVVDAILDQFPPAS